MIIPFTRKDGTRYNLRFEDIRDVWALITKCPTISIRQAQEQCRLPSYGYTYAIVQFLRNGPIDHCKYGVQAHKVNLPLITDWKIRLATEEEKNNV
jgi:hypothetical protein